MVRFLSRKVAIMASKYTENVVKTTAGAAAGGVGGAGGAAIGAAVGSLFGPAGTALGFWVGGLLAGSAASLKTVDAIGKIYDKK
jgi:hypothetical protein